MKKILALCFFIILAKLSWAQENMVTLSYGYPIANIEDVDENGSGWRINALYEFNPMDQKVAHGLSVGYVNWKVEVSSGLYDGSVEVGAWPIYYAPKFLFGSEKFKGFVKGALGWQFSRIDYEGNLIGVEDNDSGFTGGAGAGASYFLKENIFINLEYEFLWMSNSFYKDEALNTIGLGLGFRF